MIVTERALECKCGNVPDVRGRQDPNTSVWRFYGSCPSCGNCERGAHESVESAVRAWNDCASKYASSYWANTD